MSLFDSIKYPISDIPTAAELLALPEDIYLEWKRECFPSGWTAWRIRLYIKAAGCLDSYHSEVVYLRKMIAEYEHI